MKLLTGITGSENRKDAQARILMHVCKNIETGAVKETHINSEGFTGYGNDSRLVNTLSLTSTQAIQGIKEEIGGQWRRGAYEVEEGTIIKITYNVSSFNNKRSGCIYIQVRAGAPVREVTIPLLRMPDSTIPTACISGMFDSLTMDEVRDRGIILAPALDRWARSSMLTGYWTDTILAPGTAVRIENIRKTIITDDGTESTMVIKKRYRALDI